MDNYVAERPLFIVKPTVVSVIVVYIMWIVGFILSAFLLYGIGITLGKATIDYYELFFPFVLLLLFSIVPLVISIFKIKNTKYSFFKDRIEFSRIFFQLESSLFHIAKLQELG